jgi:hypothetical protein
MHFDGFQAFLVPFRTVSLGGHKNPFQMLKAPPPAD